MSITRPRTIVLAAALALLLAACGGSSESAATPQVTPTAPPAAQLPISTATMAAQATVARPPLASTSPIPSGAAPATPTPTQTEPSDYRDDRSTPVAVLESLYNAINTKQYARAYSYWEDSNERPPFDEFAQGYADTEHIDLTTGTARTGAAAGNLYYDVPVILHAALADGSHQIFAGCYTLHLSRPELQIEPPYHPMAISRGDLQQVDADADAIAIFDKGCQPEG